MQDEREMVLRRIGRKINERCAGKRYSKEFEHELRKYAGSVLGVFETRFQEEDFKTLCSAAENILTAQLNQIKIRG